MNESGAAAVVAVLEVVKTAETAVGKIPPSDAVAFVLVAVPTNPAEEVEKYRFFFFCTGSVGFYTIIFLIYKALKNKL